MKPFLPTAALVAAMACGCLRVLSPGGTSDAGPTPQGLGIHCTQDNQCRSGMCQDEVCCDARCAAAQSCALPESLGSCARRPLGAACDDATQCPTGHCADHVCCDIACDGPCSYCAVRGFEGQCQSVPLNEDYREACGPCQACFLDRCAPAIPGTNPRDACSAGMACSAVGTCALALGRACTSASECSTSRCIADMCLGYSQELVMGVFGNPNANTRRVHGSAVTGDGTLCLLLEEQENSAYPQTSAGSWLFPVRRQDYSVQCRLPGGWVATPWLQLPSGAPDPGASRLYSPLQLLAPSWGLLVLAALDPLSGANALGLDACDVGAQIYYVRDQNAGARCLLPQTGNVVFWTQALLRDERTLDLYIASDDGSGVVTIQHHTCVDFTCGPGKPVASGTYGSLPGTALQVGSRRVLLDLTTDMQVRATVDDETPVLVNLPAACALGLHPYDAFQPLRPLSAAAVDAQEVFFAVQCQGEVAAGGFLVAERAFQGVRMVAGAGNDVWDVRAVRLPEARRGLVVRNQHYASLVVVTGGTEVDHPLPLPDPQGRYRLVDLISVQGAPHLVLEEAAEVPVQVEGTVALRPTSVVRHVSLAPR